MGADTATVSIEGLDRAEVLAALYNASRPLGMGFLHYDPADMTVDEAAALLEQGTHFDYVQGRVMKVRLDRDDLRVDLYDRDNGPGKAAAVIAKLRQQEGATP